ncbi:unnamed protein product, partial [Symbiodinium sp. CCMP2456]
FMSVWHECGGHFRSYEHVCYLTRELFCRYRCPLKVNFFSEKPGKGLIDGIFARVRNWISSCLSHGDNRIIASLSDLVAVCQEAAQNDRQLDPDGAIWHVVEFKQPSEATKAVVTIGSKFQDADDILLGCFAVWRQQLGKTCDQGL